jgi:hypothetical protein
MSKPTDWTNIRVGRLVVTRRSGRSRYGHALWSCKCDCGKEFVTTNTNLKEGKTRSCGCIRKGESNWRAHKQPIEEVFWGGLKRLSPEECWEWQKTLAWRNYGIFYYHGKYHLAHRFSYELHFGPIKEGMFVCHKCDNRRCVNPSHLFLGTQSDNMRDTVAKDRLKGYFTSERTSGENSPTAKFTDKQIGNVRNMRDRGFTYEEIKQEHGISISHIARIVRNQSRNANV